MSRTRFLKGISWIMYFGLILGLLFIFSQIYIFHTSMEGDHIYYFGNNTRYIYLTINDIDSFSDTMDCEIQIPSWSSLNIRMIHVTSWYEDEFLKRVGISPTFEPYFIYPSGEEIYSGSCFDENGTIIDLSELKRNFKFELFTGIPAFWYPFDTYNVNYGISVSNSPGYGQISYPVKVTTILRENDPEFYITNEKSTLTFQKEAEEKQFGLVPDNTFSFTLERGLFIRYLTVYIYLIACIFLVYIGFSRTTNELFAGSVGYFAALWGIRNIISGKIDIFPTVIDLITLILFTILLLIIIGRLLRKHFITGD